MMTFPVRVAQWVTSLMVLTLVLSGIAVTQVKQEKRTVVINGRSGEAMVVQNDGRTYVDVETLARIANGSLGFQGSQITLTLPASASTPTSTPASTAQPEAANRGLSRNFMMAGIETIAQMREWGSTLAYAIQNGYGVTDAWVGDYRDKASSSLSQASAAASTNQDRDALQLLTNEFNGVRDWSNKLLEAKKTMDTAKYSTAPDALRNEPLSQKLITCGRFLGGMLGSGKFSDDPSCH